MPLGSIPTLDTSVVATAELFRTGYVNLYKLIAENPNSNNVAYIQLFNAAAAGDVTVGTTAPDQSYMIPLGTGNPTATSGAESGLLDLDFPPIRFNLGLVYACTTTRTGSTAPTNACAINFNAS